MVNSSIMDREPIRDLDDHDWEQQVERSPDPVFVMFYSPDCSHCTRMMPSVTDLAMSYHPRIRFYQLDLLRFGWIGERYGIMATPTFVFFCGGKPVQSQVGAVYPSGLKKMLDEMILHGDECRMKSTAFRYEIDGYG